MLYTSSYLCRLKVLGIKMARGKAPGTTSATNILVTYTHPLIFFVLLLFIYVISCICICTKNKQVCFSMLQTNDIILSCVLLLHFMCIWTERISDGTNGDVAADSYHMYEVSNEMSVTSYIYIHKWLLRIQYTAQLAHHWEDPIQNYNNHATGTGNVFEQFIMETWYVIFTKMKIPRKSQVDILKYCLMRRWTIL